jgi:energy-coupling factor transporter ATP-binding protein EcfA2
VTLGRPKCKGHDRGFELFLPSGEFHMDIIDKFKKLMGMQPVNIGELNKQATRESSSKVQIPSGNPLEGIEISEEYKNVQSLIEAGFPAVFVTGNAGTGKSTLIQYLRTVLKIRSVVVAPTGVAALNVGGVTIHSFFRFPPKILEDDDIKMVFDRKLYQKLDLLVIDEISMVRCDLMDSIDKFLRKNRSSDLPFGGVQLLLIGDLFQLPPVVSRSEDTVLKAKGYPNPYFFSSFSLQKCSMFPIELTSVYRQSDNAFVTLLNSVRVGENIDSVTQEINSRCHQSGNKPADITLCCTNKKADQINMRELQTISDKEHVFQGEIKGQFSLEEDNLPSPMNLKLKIGARVMFTKNDENRRWVNGSLGIVRHIDGESIGVELVTDHKGSIYDVKRVTWETFKYSYDAEKDQIVAHKVGAYTQYPLMLAWAVTIHKSQGKTLENVLIDLGSGAFASGQVYVALSRCRSIDGITLERPIRNTDVKCDPMIKRFYRAMDGMKRAASEDQGRNA